MTEHPLRRILSKILHDDPTGFEIAYVHRGVPGDIMKITASEIMHVGKGSFHRADGETQIPFHRILYVRNEKDGRLLWEKREKHSSNRAP